MKERFYSLDVFRGATVALMILVNNPGSWSHIYAPLEHAPWHGCTPTDLVFPFFLFAVGNSIVYVMPRMETAGTAVFLRKLFKRAILIILIGLLLNWSPFIRWDGDNIVFKSWNNVRIFGVLQRIGLCYFFASLIIFFFKTKGAFLAALLLLPAYWLLCLSLGHGDLPYSLEGFWGTHIDRALLGDNHIYKGEGVAFDPEGLVSTMPAIVQVLFGFLAGQYIQRKGKNFRMVTTLFAAAAILVGVGLLWQMVFPLNKKIWTSSFVVFTTGVAIIFLVVNIYLIELRHYKGVITRFFDVFGKNPLFIFVLSGFLPRVLGLIRIPYQLDENSKTIYLTPFGWFYENVCKPITPNLKTGSLLYAIFIVVFYWMIAYWLDKRKIYVRV